MREVVIVSAVRTPTGKFLGLKDFSAPALVPSPCAAGRCRAGVR
jgi:acetyl-CoA acetyltransferase